MIYEDEVKQCNKKESKLIWFFLIIILFVLLFTFHSSFAIHRSVRVTHHIPIVTSPEQCFLVTYGPKALHIEGDDDFIQVIFIKIPADFQAPLYLRIFDPACGSIFDARYNNPKWDTRTRFGLFGGEGAYSNPGIKKPTPDKADLHSGALLVEKDFGNNPSFFGQWYNFSVLDPKDGEKVGDFRYFKLVVEGREGDDGNRYLIDVTMDPEGKKSFPGLDMFAPSLTVNLQRDGIFVEMHFFVPKGVREVFIYNFDVADAEVRVDTAFRTGLPVRSSGQGAWAKTKIHLDEIETGRMCSVRFEGGSEMPNDATFYVTDAQGNTLPIHVPVYVWQQKPRPVPQTAFELLDDCMSVQFEAPRAQGANEDVLKCYWDFGDGSKGEGNKIIHKYNSPGKYEVSFIVVDSAGSVSNSALKRFFVTVNDPPVADAGEDRLAVPDEKLEFDGSDAFDPDGKIIRYTWDFGDGFKAEGLKVNHAFKNFGVYTVTLFVEDDSNSPCRFGSDTCIVRINAAPVPDILACMNENRQIASPGETILFSGINSIDLDGKIIAYDWDFGDGARKSGIEVTHAFEKPGVYNVNLTVTDDSTAKNHSASKTIKITVNDPPVANAGKNQRASVGEDVIFDGSKSFDRDGRLIRFEWDFEDGTVQSTESSKAVHCYNQPGAYMVVLTVVDDSDSISNTSSDEMIVIINAPPIAKAGPEQWVTGSEVRFDGSGSYDPDGNIIQYVWDFGDGDPGMGPSPVHVYRNTGTYTVRLTVTDNSSTSTNQASDEMKVIINHLPIADAGPNRIAIPGKPIQFDGSGSVDPDGEIVSYLWDFGDNTHADGMKTSHIYSQAGKYNVMLTVKDNSGHEAAEGFDNAVVFINHPPTAVIDLKSPSPASALQKDFFVVPPSAKGGRGDVFVIAPNENILFDGSRSYDPDGKIVWFHWNFSDGKEFESVKVQRNFSQPGIYTATLTVVDDSRVENSTDQQKITIRVNHQPVASAGHSIQTAERTVLLDGSGSTDADDDPLTHTWNFGDGSLDVKGVKVFHTYVKGGIYPVILTVDDGTCVNNSRSVSSITIRVHEAPIANAGENRTVCAGKIVIFDASGSKDPNGGIMKYDWNFGDGTLGQGINPTKIYNSGGFYPVTLAVTNDSGVEGANKSTDQISVNVIESPVANAGPDQTACAGTLVKFDGRQSKDEDGQIIGFNWDFGDGSTGGGPTPTHVYTKAGVYRVKLTVTGDRRGNCDNTSADEMTVTIHEALIMEFDSPTAVELGKPIDLKANRQSNQNVNIMQWDWDFGDGFFGQGEKVTHTFHKSGNYLITLTVSTDSNDECNKSTNQKRITVNQSPIAKACPDSMKHRLAGINDVLTFDGSLSKDPDGVITSYIWDFGDGETAKGIQVRHQYHKGGEYTVLLKVIDNTELPNNSATDTMLVTINKGPKPVIRTTPACAGEKFILSGDNAAESSEEITNYSWNFGDGSPAENGKEIFHIYRIAGNYVILLEVDDGKGVSNSRAQTSATISVKAPLKADAGLDRIVSPEEDVNFDGTASVDPNEFKRIFQWDFGDGATAEGQKVTHRFKNPGKYMVRLKITDNSETDCNTDESFVLIRVKAPPVANAGGSREVFFGGANDSVLFDASASYDPDGSPLTYYWDFGDNVSIEGYKVRHTFPKPGRYKVKLRVDDGTGLKSSVAADEIMVWIRERR